MHGHPKRPTPTLWCISGAISTLGVASLVARFMDNFTAFTIRQPFDSITFFMAAGGLVIGTAMMLWLASSNVRRHNAHLEAENQRLREDRKRIDDLAEVVRGCDAQGEVNTVLLRKILKHLDEKAIPLGDTQEIPRRRLHGIDGGGGA